jgi:hypothetical protein
MSTQGNPTTDPVLLEIDRLTLKDSPERTKHFRSLLLINARHWRQREPHGLLESKWLLAEARLARFDAEFFDDLGSLFYQEAKSWLTQHLQSLLAQSDPAWILRCPRRLTLLRRLLPHEALRIWNTRS